MLRAEYQKHPITLQATKAYSPASIGKAYLQAMGIPPILERQPDFPKEYLGHAASAFFGGRTSAHIRKVAVPVVYTDFVSMYPTVNSLMGLWRFVIANKIQVVEHCKNEISEFLNNLRANNLFNPETWPMLCGFVQIIPDGDILPSRAKYNDESNDWQVAVNYIHGTRGNSQHLLWYSLPDIVASVILTGRVPNIVDAFLIEPVGTLPGVSPVKLRSTIPVDPRKEDFFRVVIEQRKGLSSRKDISDTERQRLDKALKVLANATSYGIYAEMNREESDHPVNVICYGIDAESFTCRVPHPDVPGKYCFPPLAALITGGARLMLALLEHSVTERGGTYAMEDTDSMAIVATENGATVRCAQGPDLEALSWKEVDEIVARFALLNPYQRNVANSILKIEDDNFDPKTKAQRQLYCFAISAKRYVLFLRGKNGRPTLLRERVNNYDDRWSQHGLGHLLNPTELESEDREWIAQVWLDIVRRAGGRSSRRLRFRDMPAVGRVSVSSPAVMKPLSGLNFGKKYPDQMKPFNFLLTCHVRRAGHPTGADEEHFHLIAPYESDPSKWAALPWIDQYSANQYGITTKGHHGTRNTARVRTYGEVVREYEFHAESKCADRDGNVCDKQTIGLLQRRHVPIDFVRYIGKESNSLEEVVEGLVHDEKNVYTEYPDPRRDEWTSKILPALKKAKLSTLEKLTGLSRRTFLNLRAGRSRPNNKTRTLILSALRDMGLI